MLLVIGGRLSESPSSSYTLIDIPQPRQTLIHVYPDPEEIGRVYQPALGIVASPHAFASALSTVSTRSIKERSSTSGMNPAPMP